MEVDLELHVFSVHNADALGPLVLFLPSRHSLEVVSAVESVATAASAQGAERHEELEELRCSAAVKAELAALVGLRPNVLKFCPQAKANALLARGLPLSPPAVALTFPSFDLELLYRIRGPLLRRRAPSLSGAELVRAAGATRLASGDVLSNLALLEERAAWRAVRKTGHPVAAGAAAGYVARCPRCRQLRPIPGRERRPAWRCSGCLGDSEGLLAIRRLCLASRASRDPAAEGALRVKLQRALKAGHAEAAAVILRAVRPQVRDLDRAIRCRRVGLLAQVLARCEEAVVQHALRGAAAEPKNAWARKAQLFDFPGLRAQLLEARALTLSDPLELLQRPRWCVLLCLKRIGDPLPAPIRQKVFGYLPATLADLACVKLAPLLERTELMAIPLDYA